MLGVGETLLEGVNHWGCVCQVCIWGTGSPFLFTRKWRATSATHWCLPGSGEQPLPHTGVSDVLFKHMRLSSPEEK